ncbi:MAG: hypothetical protein LBF16_00260 [Pseudomonadales bacterium]|jgi:hypothetical protein|nr:hypothetical protein [Pseudomonadales bacterium]
MTTDDFSRSHRFALKLALAYLLIRIIPELLLGMAMTLPENPFTALLPGFSQGTSDEGWIYSPLVLSLLPLPTTFGLPGGFQSFFAVVSTLLLEALLVFVFSAGFLRRRPWAASQARQRKPWIVLFVVTLVLTCGVRLLLQRHFNVAWIMGMQAVEDYEKLPLYLIKANTSFFVLLHLSAPLWTLLPTWLYFRSIKPPADVLPRASTDSASSLQRGAAFVMFMLSAWILHIALTQAFYLVLLPWTMAEQQLYGANTALEGVLGGWTLIFSQIVLPGGLLVLAAWIYTRRAATPNATTFQTFGKPALSGVAVYLLTSFSLLLLLWIMAWLAGGLPRSLSRLRGTDELISSLITTGLVVNVLSALLLCGFSAGLRRSPRRWSRVLAAMVFCAAIPATVLWSVAGSRQGLIGGKPGAAITGTLGDARWRNMQQWCTGIVETRHGIWLVGRDDRPSESATWIPQDAQDLSLLMDGQPREEGALTTLSRLQDDGSFKLMATVPGVVCMVVDPNSDALYLLTGMRRPNTLDIDQTVVLRSIDQGANWQWLETGFMVEANHFASQLEPIFGGTDDVWAWGSGTLWHASAQDLIATPVESAEQLDVPESWEPGSERFIAPVDAAHAFAWISRDEQPMMRATLMRQDARSPWRIAAFTEQPGISLRQMQTSTDGRTYAIVKKPDGEWMVRLDVNSGEWVEPRRLPVLMPRWLVKQRAWTRYFWNNGDYQVVTLDVDMRLPRLLFPFSDEALETDANVHFYTRDGGRSWHRLAIPDYLGVMGLSPRGSKLYWNKGNWYRNDEPVQRQYDLRR